RRCARRECAIRDRLGEVRVEVIGTAHTRIGRKRSCRKIVWYARVESAPAAEHLHPIGASRIPRGSESGGPFVTERHLLQRARQALVVVPQPGIDGEVRAEAPAVLYEERREQLRGSRQLLGVG